MGSQYPRFVSSLLRAASALEEAVIFSPDPTAREGLQRAEAEVRGVLRARHIPSPDERRIFVKEDGP